MEKEIPRKFHPHQRDQAVDRNKDLTDTVIQNNRIIASQAKQLLEAHNLISNLKEELSLLKEKHSEDAELEEANKKIENLEALLESLRMSESEDGSNKVFGNALKKNEEDYKDKLRAAKVTIIQLKRRLQEVEEQKNEQLTANRRLMQEKFEEYQRELDESNKRIEWLENQVVKAKGEVDSEEFERLKEKLFQSELDISRKINEITTLTTELEEAKQAADNVSKLQIKLQNVLAERDHIAADLQSKNFELADVKSKLTHLERSLLETNQNVLNMENQVKLENLKAKYRIDELERELQRAQTDLDLKTQQLLAQQSDSAELTDLRQQLVQSQSALNEAVQKRTNAEADVADANREAERLSQQLKMKDDDLLTLQAQMESHKSDFYAERESLQKEKDANQKMSEELQQLHKSNRLLQEELDILRREMYSPGRAPHGGACCSIPPPPPNYYGYYTCPKCHNTFHNFSQQDAEYHVYHCMT